MTSGSPNTSGPRGRLVISGCGIISPIGIGVDAFNEGVWARRSGRRPLESAAATTPIETACVIPEFDVANFLGSKGIRNMDRTTALAVAAAGLALRDRALHPAPPADRVGVVLGTSTGSIRSAWNFTSETLTRARPYQVDPGVFPSTILNCAASQCAIWHRLKGVNVTIAGGPLSGVLGLRYADVCLRQRYADLLLVGAVEEYSEPVGWAFVHTRPAAAIRAQPPGEGCAFFVLERPDLEMAEPPWRGEVASTDVGVCPATDDRPDARAHALADCITRALTRAGAAPKDVVAVSKRGSSDPVLRAAEEQALDAALGGHQPSHQLAIADLIGETFSASSAFQLAALLAAFDRVDHNAPPYGLVVSMARDGAMGCSVIRRPGGRAC
jgi:3-oxoacyl-[acyl-carrier-protein] synthase II